MRKTLLFAILAGGVIWSVTAVAGEDTSFFIEANRAPTLESLRTDELLHSVNLEEQRGAGGESSIPTTSSGSTGAVAVILWDEVSKGRTQNSSANIGVGIQNTNVHN